MINITSNKEIVIQHLVKVSEEFDDDVEEAVRRTAEAVKSIAQRTIDTYFELRPDKFNAYYEEDIKTRGKTAEVTITGDYIPLIGGQEGMTTVGNFPYSNTGRGTQGQTVRGDYVTYKIRKGSEYTFASNQFIGRGHAYKRTSSNSYPIKAFFTPRIPAMLAEEEDVFEEEIKQTLIDKIKLLVG